MPLIYSKVPKNGTYIAGLPDKITQAQRLQIGTSNKVKAPLLCTCHPSGGQSPGASARVHSDLLPGFAEQGIGPDFSPEEGVAAGRWWSSDNPEQM